MIINFFRRFVKYTLRCDYNKIHGRHSGAWVQLNANTQHLVTFIGLRCVDLSEFSFLIVRYVIRKKRYSTKLPRSRRKKSNSPLFLGNLIFEFLRDGIEKKPKLTRLEEHTIFPRPHNTYSSTVAGGFPCTHRGNEVLLTFW